MTEKKKKNMTTTMEMRKTVKIQHLLITLTILKLGIERNLNLIKEIYEKPMQSFLMVIMVTY